MPDNKEQNPKANMASEPNGTDGCVQHPHSIKEQQLGEMNPKAKYKRQRRIEDWFPN